MPNVSASAAPIPRLYLAIPADIEAGALTTMAEVLAKADVAAVLLRLPEVDPRSQTERVKAFAVGLRATGAALLVDGHPEIVARGGADGAHLTGVAGLKAAQSSLQPQRIAGVGGLATRHDAMVAGEAGADYVMFGEPALNGARPAIDAIAERVAWWSEIFEIPCVGYASSRDDAAILAAAGADFVLVEGCIWSHPQETGAALMDAAQAIRQSQP